MSTIAEQHELAVKAIGEATTALGELARLVGLNSNGHAGDNFVSQLTGKPISLRAQAWQRDPIKKAAAVRKFKRTMALRREQQRAQLEPLVVAGT